MKSIPPYVIAASTQQAARDQRAASNSSTVTILPMADEQEERDWDAIVLAKAA